MPIIDVLRAVAIALVVVYHVVPQIAPGGLVGVDVFFVVSGYLILGQIAEEAQAGQLSLIDFFKRRGLRIVPALTIVLLVSAVAAAVVLVTPQEVAGFRQDFLWSGAFAANILYSDTLGYFDSVAGRHPLLHLWSLGVEEQFYLSAPVAILLSLAAAGLWPRSRMKFLLAAGVLAGVLSLGAWVFESTGGEAQRAFYLPQFRLWEFLIGGAARAALPFLHRVPGRVLDVALLGGLVCIGLGAGSTSADLVYPGYAIPLSAAGAALAIGGGAQRASSLVNVLAWPPVLFIGLISYEIYLWHWPILVFLRTANFGELPPTLAILGLAVAVLLAAPTHFVLSRRLAPLRLKRGPVPDLIILTALLGACAGAIVVSYVGLGVSLRNVAASVPIRLVPDLQHVRSCNLLDADSPEAACVAPPPALNGLVIGDSHAGANFSAFAQLAKTLGVGLQFASFAGCTPFLTIDRRNDFDAIACRRWHASVRRKLAGGTLPVDFAIITAQWMFHVDDLIGPSQEAAFKEGLATDIAILQTAGARRILVIGSPPLLPREPGDCIIRADRYRLDRNLSCAEPRAQYAAQTRNLNPWIRSVTLNEPGVRFADPATIFCDDQWCSPVREGISLFSDHDHLSAAGAELLAIGAKEDLHWVMSTPN